MDEQPEGASDELLRHRILKLRRQGREWADIAVEIGLATERASVQTRLNRIASNEVASEIKRDEVNEWLRTNAPYGRG